MIKSIKIRNFILIENIEIEFSSKLNIITGETGSGKSMLIDAMIILFGGRAYADFVRKGENKAFIEAELIDYNLEINQILGRNDIDIFDNLLILRREISNKGQSRCFINDTPVNLNILKEIGNLLIDFHGQYEHQFLLNPTNHIMILDNISNYKDDIFKYQNSFNQLKKIYYEIENLIKLEKEYRQKSDYNKFVLDEINKIAPLPNEDQTIENELIILENSEQILAISNEVYEMLYNNDISIFVQLSTIISKLEKLQQFNLNIKAQSNELDSARIITKEIAIYFNDLLNKYDFDPQKIENLRLRHIQLKTLKKKYGSLKEIIELKQKLENENQNVLNYSGKINQLKNDYIKIQKKTSELALILSEKRKKETKKLSKLLEQNLNKMGINYVDFEVVFGTEKSQNDTLSLIIDNIAYLPNEKGIDLIEFFISTNKGQEKAPLSEVASGGEISRIMLSLKEIISKSDIIDTMVFDEIDVGISGRIAQMVGSVMKGISKNKQIIAITHLAQIAAFGDLNISLRKDEINHQEITKAQIIEDKDKLIEIAKMISGAKVTENSLATASELINFVNIKK